MECKAEGENKFLHNNQCVSFCPRSNFMILGNKSCKRCSDENCSEEIPRTNFNMISNSPLSYTAKIDKKIFFKSFYSENKLLLETSDENKKYCRSQLKGMKEGVDYKVTNSSKFIFNQLECTAEFEFFRSFRDKEVEIKLDPSLNSGGNMIIGEDDNPIYIRNGVYKIEKYQRYKFFGFC